MTHAFLHDRFRINAGSSADFLADLTPFLEQQGKTDEFKSILEDAKLDVVSFDAATKLLEFVQSSLPHLEKVRAWWDGLEGSLSITPVGIAIAYSNAKRFDDLPGLPTLTDLISRA